MNAFAALADNLDDSLDDVFRGLGRERLPEGVAPKAPIPVEAFTEPCKACNGSGKFRGYTGRILGDCFKCKGKGNLAFKTSPEQRAAGRASEARRNEVAANDKLGGFATENADEYGWMLASSQRGFGFAISMIEAVKKFGHLTERQLAAVQRCMVQDAERTERREQEAKDRAEREANAKTVDITRIVASMAKAMDKGIKRPVLRLDTFKFSRASSGPNALYVRDAANTDLYLGKIIDGRFQRSRDCTAEQEERIIAAAADPLAAARTYGRKTGSCSCCGRELTNGESIELGIGPICAGKFF